MNGTLMLLPGAPGYVAPQTYVQGGLRLPSGAKALPGITAADVQRMATPKAPTVITKIKLPTFLLKARPAATAAQATQSDTFDVTPGVLVVGLLLVAGAGYVIFRKGNK